MKTKTEQELLSILPYHMLTPDVFALQKLAEDLRAQLTRAEQRIAEQDAVIEQRNTELSNRWSRIKELEENVARVQGVADARIASQDAEIAALRAKVQFVETNYPQAFWNYTAAPVNPSAATNTDSTPP